MQQPHTDLLAEVADGNTKAWQTVIDQLDLVIERLPGGGGEMVTAAEGPYPGVPCTIACNVLCNIVAKAPIPIPREGHK
jgi:hypothetical protein